MIYTIGFTQTTAESFFNRLTSASVLKVIDVRLNNTSQLAGFAKSTDLAFFLKRLGPISYEHLPLLAPQPEMLAEYKKGKRDWAWYETQFMNLMRERRIESTLAPENLEGACLLCSEHRAHHCHRRLVCDYLNLNWGNVLSVKHL